MSHVNKVQPIRITAIRVNFCLLLLSNGINDGIGHTCNTIRVYHDTIITCATADSFCLLFPHPLHNPHSHTCAYVTHMTVNYPGVTSRKVRYGSRDCQGHTKKWALRHIHVENPNTKHALYDVGASLVLQCSEALTEAQPGQYHFVFDNFFTSIALPD
jgi:hypothetical protein